MTKREECTCGHGKEWHTFGPGGESLCDLCGCDKYELAALPFAALFYLLA
jgi:hypothetical protein